jgi:hypothetical protein
MQPQIYTGFAQIKLMVYTEAAQKILSSLSALYSCKDIIAVLHREVGDAVVAVVEGRRCPSQAAITNKINQQI